MKEEINKLINAITEDYFRWNERSIAANGWEHTTAEAKADEFRAGIEIKEGSKYIKITTDNSVWGFINKGNPDFEVGDILKAANWRAPALNKARGNIFGRYSVAWTGPHYIAGYSAGGNRAPVGKTGLLKGNSRVIDGSIS
jgi:hypothetical protein